MLFIEDYSIYSLNYRIIQKNLPNISKLVFHLLKRNYYIKLNKFLDIFPLCPQLETVQISTSCPYNQQIIDFILSTLQSISSSESRKIDKFALILGFSIEAPSQYIPSSLEYGLERNVEGWTKELAKITINYCILAQIMHLHSYYDGEKELMNIYGKQQGDYIVYDDNGFKITKPCDISTNWLMIVSKSISPEIIIGDFRIKNNLNFLCEPCDNVLFRPPPNN